MAAGPYKLLTVNASSERATALVESIVELAKSDYTIVNVGNVESIDGVKAAVAEKTPDVVVIAASFSSEGAAAISAAAKEGHPAVKTLALPQSVLAEKGPEGLVVYIKDKWAELVQ